jgi:hypothetical protein
LVVLEQRGAGGGRSGTLFVVFVESRPWWEGPIDVELLEAALGLARRAGRCGC